MADRVEVRMGEYAVAKEGKLCGTGIGSCLLICLYDPKTKIGGMAHAMLPSRAEARESAKYADSAIEIMLREMQKLGADRGRTEARLIGGARMFQTQDNANSLNIGGKNARSAKEKLQKEKIRITGEDTGGSHGRSAEFDLETGIITVKTVL